MSLQLCFLGSKGWLGLIADTFVNQDASATTTSRRRHKRHLITGLTNGTAYTFTVTATNVMGASLASSPSNSVTPAPTAPDAPTNVSGTGSYRKATISFTPPADNGGAAITGYTVTSSPAGGVDSNAGSTGLSHLVTGLTDGTAYTFTVTGTNAAGTSLPSAPSNSVTPAPTAPNAPTKVKAAAGDSQASVSFTAPAANGSPITVYTVTSNPGGVTATGASSPIVITGLTNGTTYSFTVTATNAIGTSDPSTPSNSIIAMLMPQAYYIHTDHLDTPRQITDSNANVVWQWDNTDPFGNNIPNENPNGAGQFSFNLRFPGQYFDKETGLHYNFHRDYDPATGRYIESDPIGLAGGSFSTYIYVNGNPLRWADPSGLCPENPKCKTPRLPDYLTFQIDLYVISFSATYTKYGDIFSGIGVSRQYPAAVTQSGKPSVGVSISDGWLLQCDNPTSQ